MDATTSEKKIREWFTTNPFANVAIDVGGAGMMVLDLDPGHDVGDLEAVVGQLPDTQMRAKTPRGGEHLFFRLDEGEVIPPSVSKLSAHVDVRSFNSYVLVYPSRTHDGVYEWECDPATVKPAHRTDTMAEVSSKTARMKSQDRDNWLIKPDIPENVASAVRWLKDDAQIAVEGLGGDATAYATAAYMKSLGISQPMASSLMWEHWNPRCDPPWSSGEWEHFETKIENAYAYNTSPPGNLTQAYEAEHPWADIANAALGPDGEVLSGWLMRHAHLPARVAPEHSETAYMTDRAMTFIEDAGAETWCLHLSYIKPHWPYIAPAPWHDLYRDMDVPGANRAEAERADPNPIHAAFMDHAESREFSRDETRNNVIPTYLGLIAEIDHHVGRLMAFLEEQGLADNTVVVFTSDHGDYLGDHWLGEKDLYHEEIVKVPLIIADPRPAADGARGRVVDAFAEAIDLAPTFVEMAGGEPEGHRLEGRSLTGQLAGDAGQPWRDCVFSDGCFGKKPARVAMGLEPTQTRSFMARTDRWKYMHFLAGPPMLFDLQEDPHELHDLGRDPGYADIRAAMKDRLFDWMMTRRLRPATSDASIERQTAPPVPKNWLIGVW
jgi:arylsulfatase A-like enzyme